MVAGPGPEVLGGAGPPALAVPVGAGEPPGAPDAGRDAPAGVDGWATAPDETAVVGATPGAPGAPPGAAAAVVGGAGAVAAALEAFGQIDA